MKFEAVNQLFIQSLLIFTYKQQFSSCNRLKIARYSFVNIHLKLTICKRSEFKILRRTQVNKNTEHLFSYLITYKTTLYKNLKHIGIRLMIIFTWSSIVHIALV